MYFLVCSKLHQHIGSLHHLIGHKFQPAFFLLSALESCLVSKCPFSLFGSTLTWQIMHLIRGLLTRSPFSYLRKNPDFQYMTTDLPAFRSLDWFQLVFMLRYPHTYLYIYIYECPCSNGLGWLNIQACMAAIGVYHFFSVS